jgi:hypothetical protein
VDHPEGRRARIYRRRAGRLEEGRDRRCAAAEQSSLLVTSEPLHHCLCVQIDGSSGFLTSFND